MIKAIKVLHIIKSLGRGGAEMLLPETLKLHNKNQFEFHYIYFLSWKDQMVEEIQAAGGRVTCFPASNNIKILLQWRRIFHYIQDNNIQFIHCHLPWAGFVGRLIYRYSGTPVLYTEHNKQERYHGITKLINRITFSWQTKVIAVSGNVAESILKNIGNKVPVCIINNGVNTSFYKRSGELGKELRVKFGIRDEAIVVGIVTVFRFQKRLKEWVDVFEMSYKTCPQLYGFIVGDGPLKKEVENYIRSKNLNDRIILPGLQTDVKPWYSVMDVFMMTSEFEGLPLALLEAMSMECAIVITNAGGIKDVVRNGKDGLMVDVNEWKTLSGCLQQLILSESLRRSLAAAARVRVEENFGMKGMVDELEKLYEGLCRKLVSGIMHGNS